MDKETLSHYGWIVILVIILAILLGLAQPFGQFIKVSFMNTNEAMKNTGDKALPIINGETTDDTDTSTGTDTTTNYDAIYTFKYIYNAENIYKVETLTLSVEENGTKLRAYRNGGTEMLPQDTSDNATLESYKNNLMYEISEGWYSDYSGIPATAAWNDLFTNNAYFEALDGITYNGTKYIPVPIAGGGGDQNLYDISIGNDIECEHNCKEVVLSYDETLAEGLVWNANKLFDISNVSINNTSIHLTLNYDNQTINAEFVK